MIAVTDQHIDYLGKLFIKEDILNKKGITFAQFIEYWKRGKLEEALN